MKNKSLLFLLIVIAFTSIGCKKGSIHGIKTENFSNGKAGEILFVMDYNLFNDSLKVDIINILTQPQPSINQEEPMFDLLKLKNSDFNSIFQRHRNIVHFDVNQNYSFNKLEIETNVWASPQVYIHFKCNNPDSCYQLFLKNQNEIINLLYENDLARLQSFYVNDHNPAIEKKIKEKFGFTISVPKNYSIAREEKDFIWLLFRTNKNDRCIMIYKTNSIEFSEQNLIKLRNEITKKYIPGAETGSYPIIDPNKEYLNYTPLQVGNTSGFLLKGLWISMNDIMGGPFYTYAFNDSKSNNCIVVDGFVHAPHEKKRDYIREVEAIVKTIK
jgi:hypothetical protein